MKEVIMGNFENIIASVGALLIMCVTALSAWLVKKIKEIMQKNEEQTKQANEHLAVTKHNCSLQQDNQTLILYRLDCIDIRLKELEEKEFILKTQPTINMKVENSNE